MIMATYILPEGAQVLDVIEHKRNREVKAKIPTSPDCCLHCKHHKIVGFGRRKETIQDIPFHGKQVSISLNRRRYRCSGCRKTFLQPVPWKDHKRRMTNRLVQYIVRESRILSFCYIAGYVGVDEKTVRNIFNDYCK